MFSEGSSKTHVWKVKLTFPFWVRVLSPSSFTLQIEELFCCIYLLYLFFNLLFKSGGYKALKHGIAELYVDTAYACVVVYDVHALGKTVCIKSTLVLLQMARSYCCLGLGMWENGIARSWEVTIFNVAGECGKLLTLTGQILLLLLMLSGTLDETCRWNVLLIVRRGVRAWPRGLYNSTHSQFTSPEYTIIATLKASL